MSARQRLMDLIGSGAILLVILLLALPTAVVNMVSKQNGEKLAIGGAVLGSLMWALSLILLVLAVRRYRVASDREERLIAGRQIREAGSRSLAKLSLAATLFLLFLSRYHNVLLLIRRYPLLLYALILFSVSVFSVNEMLQWWWDAEFLRWERQRIRMEERLRQAEENGREGSVSPPQ